MGKVDDVLFDQEMEQRVTVQVPLIDLRTVRDSFLQQVLKELTAF